jgi:hypothetical protein
MNNIHEKDWAEDDWGGHSGMRSNPYDDDGDYGAPALPENPAPETDAPKKITESAKQI